MNDYEILLKQHYDRVLAERQWRKNDQFLEDLAQNAPPRASRLRFLLRFPHFQRFQFPCLVRPCGHASLDTQ
jgi:hypothetical protein